MIRETSRQRFDMQVSTGAPVQDFGIFSARAGRETKSVAFPTESWVYVPFGLEIFFTDQRNSKVFDYPLQVIDLPAQATNFGTMGRKSTVPYGLASRSRSYTSWPPSRAPTTGPTWKWPTAFPRANWATWKTGSAKGPGCPAESPFRTWTSTTCRPCPSRWDRFAVPHLSRTICNSVRAHSGSVRSPGRTGPRFPCGIRFLRSTGSLPRRFRSRITARTECC